jgi:mono/diheme cytochrome c family protein
MKFFSGVVCGLVLAVGVPALALYTGMLSMGASEKPSELEKKIGTMAWETSAEKLGPKTANPFGNKAEALKAGFDHYKENCFVCHAAPGVKSSEIAQGMNPAPPILDDVEDLTDGQLYWVVKNGIRMTGMPAFGPTHDDDEIWKIVTFIRHIPKLTPEEKASLTQASENEEHHHEEETGAAKKEEHQHHH